MEEASAARYPEYDLKDGDEIRLGEIVFRVGIQMPIVCSECSAEIPQAELDAAAGQTMACLCRQCQIKLQQAASPHRTIAEPVKLCVKCGRDVSQEAGATGRASSFAPAAATTPSS